MGNPLDGMNVAVTGFLTTDNPYPGLGIARCLRFSNEFSGSITGLIFETLSNGVFAEGILDHVYLVPYPAGGADALFRRIEEIHSKNPIHVIIPSLDSEVMLYAQLAERLDRIGIRFLMPSMTGVKQRGKNLLYEFGLKNGIKVPKTIALNNLEELNAKVQEVGTPFLLKGILNDAILCSSFEEGEIEYLKLFETWGYPILLQQFIFGEEYDVITLMDRGSRLMGGLTMKKFGFTEKGKACAGITVENEELLALAEHILKALGWVGPSECEFIRDNKTGDFYLLEVNARFPSWVYLAAEAGQNLPLMAVKLAAGLPVEPLKMYSTGRLFVRTIREQVLSHFKLIELSATGELHL